MGLAPRGGWAERAIGAPILGVSIGYPMGDLSGVYNTSTGFLLWRNLWAKLRFGAIEFVGGYQKLPRNRDLGGALFVYPFTTSLVLRAPEALFRPYVTGGGGLFGWESRVRISTDGTQEVSSGWKLGWSAGVGVEYYLRTGLALDVGLRYYRAGALPTRAQADGADLQFLHLWIGHLLRF